uniref:Uncharacterized protein n=1 Tax=Candidatus Kentrum sp. TC TaxID=2126339 RepID=A0A450YN01_9GAMM|nr:MAG: hypothetical protein BECKTC1821D_GA0114238_101421 [Candidatus Kentron sp. TC]VFK57284.1 MAG: hypothetical protein BECKTC1821F_GA0114240_101634 [Candidatus Kentron sp. TC]
MELCYQLDQIKPKNQEVICRFPDMAVRQERIKYIIADPIHAVR